MNFRTVVVRILLFVISDKVVCFFLFLKINIKRKQEQKNGGAGAEGVGEGGVEGQTPVSLI